MGYISEILLIRLVILIKPIYNHFRFGVSGLTPSLNIPPPISRFFALHPSHFLPIFFISHFILFISLEPPPIIFSRAHLSQDQNSFQYILHLKT